ncbi:MAG TPA: hypothetical protein VJ890_21660 [Vineibacter sp.]|nr:hypothetical protein [Vineibacter sp.]
MIGAESCHHVVVLSRIGPAIGYGSTRVWPAWADPWSAGIIAACGPLAELFFDPSAPLNATAIATDDRRVWRAALELADGDERRAREWWRQVRSAAVDVVAENWAAVERVAAALMRHGALDEVAVRSVAGVVTRAPPPPILRPAERSMLARNRENRYNR